MAKAVMGEAMKGQLATVKYLFEVASIYPPATDGEQATSEEDSLAKTLLRRLHLPEDPINLHEEDEAVKTPDSLPQSEEKANGPEGQASGPAEAEVAEVEVEKEGSVLV